MTDEKQTPEDDIDPAAATTEGDVSDGAEQKQKPVDPPVIDEVR
jgi:hypothetical protein